MYIQFFPNRNYPPAILWRESYHQNGKVSQRTLANLSKWPSELIEQFQQFEEDDPDEAQQLSVGCFVKVTEATPIQQRAFELLEMPLWCTQ